MFERILVAYDGSEASDRALDGAIDLAIPLKAALFAVVAEEGVVVPDTVPGLGPTEPDLPTESTARVVAELGSQAARAVSAASARGIGLTALVASGEDEVQEILDAITDNGCDLLVLGATRHSGFLSSLFRHPSRTLEEHAPCSVLIVR